MLSSWRRSSNRGEAVINYYERHIGDYVRDTSHLSLLEHGVYARLMDVYYAREAAIPADQVQRLIGARSKDEKAALESVLTEFFELVDGHWHQRRCDALIEEHAAFIEHQRAAGQSSARKRSANRNPTTVQPPLKSGCNQTPTEIQPPTPTPTPTPTPNRSEEHAPECVSRETDNPHGVWIACRERYPAGLWGGPKEILAERAISKLLDDGVKRDELVQSAASYCAQQEALGKVGTEFIRGPEKFYGDGFWRGPFPMPAEKRHESNEERIRRKFLESA